MASPKILEEQEQELEPPIPYLSVYNWALGHGLISDLKIVMLTASANLQSLH